MSTNDRDTHFQGFAKLLWDELVRANEYGYIDVNTDDDPTDPTDYLTLIARRAYDLVEYTLLVLDIDTTRALISDVPDLTFWPPTE